MANIQNPTSFSFAASADHNATNGDGSDKVQTYVVQVLLSGTVAREVNVGKPAPAGGTITIPAATIISGLATDGTQFQVRPIAVGPAGRSGGSVSADTFSRTGATGVPAAPSSPTIS